MTSSATDKRSALATDVEINNDTLSVKLADGRTIAAPLDWYPRLAEATADERRSWRLIAGGRGIHWSVVDEDISVANLLSGERSAETKRSLKRWRNSRARPSRTRRARPKSS